MRRDCDHFLPPAGSPSVGCDWVGSFRQGIPQCEPLSHNICGPVVDPVVLTTLVPGFAGFNRFVRLCFQFFFHDGHARVRNQTVARGGSR